MSLTAGDRIHDFDLPTDGGGRLSAKRLKGTRVVLYFYPKDDTSGCTKEALAFGEAIAAFREAGAEIVGVSRDSVASHDKFKKKHALPFALVSDGEGTLSRAFGVWREKRLYGRTYMGVERATFLVDETGVIRKVWRNVKVPGHVDDVLDALKSVQGPD